MVLRGKQKTIVLYEIKILIRKFDSDQNVVKNVKGFDDLLGHTCYQKNPRKSLEWGPFKCGLNNQVNSRALKGALLRALWAHMGPNPNRAPTRTGPQPGPGPSDKFFFVPVLFLCKALCS